MLYSFHFSNGKFPRIVSEDAKFRRNPFFPSVEWLNPLSTCTRSVRVETSASLAQQPRGFFQRLSTRSYWRSLILEYSKFVWGRGFWNECGGVSSVQEVGVVSNNLINSVSISNFALLPLSVGYGNLFLFQRHVLLFGLTRCLLHVFCARTLLFRWLFCGKRRRGWGSRRRGRRSRRNGSPFCVFSEFVGFGKKLKNSKKT